MPEFDFSQLSDSHGTPRMSGLRSYDKLKELIQKDERYKRKIKRFKSFS